MDKYCSFCSLVIFYPATAPALAALLADIAWGSIQDFYCLSRIYWILWTMYPTVAPKVFCCHMAIPFSEVLHLSLFNFVQSLGSVHLKILECLSRFFFLIKAENTLGILWTGLKNCFLFLQFLLNVLQDPFSLFYLSTKHFLRCLWEGNLILHIMSKLKLVDTETHLRFCSNNLIPHGLTFM